MDRTAPDALSGSHGIDTVTFYCDLNNFSKPLEQDESSLDAAETG